MNNYNTAAPTRNNVFIGEKTAPSSISAFLTLSSYGMHTNVPVLFYSAVLLAIACVLFAIRVLLVAWRQIKKPLYRDVNPDAMSPMEIADKQKMIFK